MNNIEIGPSSEEELLGDYAHARLMIRRIRNIIENLKESTLTAPGGHFRQVTAIQRGISITGAYDIGFSDDIIISNLKSYYMEIFGFSV